MLTTPELRKLSDSDLAHEVASVKDALMALQIGIRTGHRKDTHKISVLKKHLARVLTLLNQRKHAGEVVDTSDKSAAKALADARAELTKAPTTKKPTAKAEPKKAEKIEAKDDSVKVKAAPKKGLKEKLLGKKES